MVANTEPCPECGRTDLKSTTALAVHRSRAHGVVGVSRPKTPRKRKAPAEATTKPKLVRKSRTSQIVLKEVWSNKDGKMILVDREDHVWVATKLD